MDMQVELFRAAAAAKKAAEAAIPANPIMAGYSGQIERSIQAVVRHALAGLISFEDAILVCNQWSKGEEATSPFKSDAFTR